MNVRGIFAKLNLEFQWTEFSIQPHTGSPELCGVK